MISIRWVTPFAVLVGAFFAAPCTSKADDASEAYRECLSKIRSINERIVSSNSETARQTVARIQSLLQSGKRNQALRLANTRINSIERNSQNAIGATERVCNACLRKLRRLGAHELANRLAVQCRASIEAINTSKMRAIHAIRSAFD